MEGRERKKKMREARNWRGSVVRCQEEMGSGGTGFRWEEGGRWLGTWADMALASGHWALWPHRPDDL